MATTFGGTVKLTGESDYIRALKTITSNLTVLNSELKLVSAQYGENDKTAQSYKEQNEVLNKQVEEQTNKVNIYKKILADLQTQQSKNREEHGKLSISLEDENQKLEQLKNTTSSTSKEIQDQQKVVSSLESALVKNGNEYTSASLKSNKYQTEINKANTEIANLSTQIDSNNKAMNDAGKTTDDTSSALKDYTSETSNASTGTLKLGDLIKANLISEAIIGGVKALGSAFKQMGSAVVEIGNQAVQSYADYEQLAGGVETLFKGSSSIVENYANNAYKTAGLSANEYMSTVTSFSASLLQSLNGDTEKSAKVADMAITDMSDNANKMGTDMASIQTAYQGFAKQNYTMLDNLKLGYGGTKEEMQRLLDDASKLSGTKYDISNLNDVYSAIHVVQTELGVTGTTAKEASVTITGSVSAMKSSWTNLLAGLANGDADLSSLINNVVDSALTVADNILPVVEQVASSILDVLPSLLDNIISHLPEFLQTGSSILTSIITGLQSNMSSIMTAVMQIMNMLIKTLIQNLPQIIDMGIQMLVSLVQGIATSLPQLIPTIIDAVLLIIETLLDNIDLIIDAGISILLGLVDGIVQALPKLIDKIPEIIDKLILALTNNLPKLIEAGIQITIALTGGLIKAIPQLLSKLPEIITSIVTGLLSGLGSIQDVGKNMIQGLWNGISNAKDWILNKISGFSKDVLNSIKSFFGIHSPSTVFKDEIGKNLALGLGEGFTSEMSNVNKEIQKSLPTDFDLDVNTAINSDYITNQSSISEYSNLINAFKEALKEVSIVLDDDKVGDFVIDKVEKVVFN